MENIQIFKYNENPISFQMGEQKMMNATQMAKFFGKRPVDWLRFQQSQEFLTILSKVRNHTFEELVIIHKGAPNVGGGTWMHEDVALEFARWLSPEFAIWCNDRIKELFRFGITATDEMLVKAATDPEFVVAMMDQVKISRKKNLELEEHNRRLQAQIDENIPKINFYDNIKEANDKAKKQRTTIISKIAKRVGMNATSLNKHLLRENIIVRTENGFAVHPQYENDNIAYPQTAYRPRTNDEGARMVVEEQYLTYTQAGEDLIFKSLEKERLRKAQK